VTRNSDTAARDAEKRNATDVLSDTAMLNQESELEHSTDEPTSLLG